MKILRIQFQNLNSLPFGDIDLEHGPLSEAGVFAITGPTGAGKSTVLDAITLALYGRAARYDNTSNPEDMMSRHTGGCQAEVIFEVRGERYRAEWQLRRARGRADGNLQPATRRIYDRDGQVLAQNITEADRQIVELTGLNYERFLRSALLAQGQFAQFLKASESQRAELLESLTGATIYSELGTLAYREATLREQALEQKETAMGRVVLLSEEERTGKSTDIEHFAAELAALSQARDTLAQRIEKGRQLEALVADQAAISGKQTALEVEREKAAPALQRLARHRLAEPFYPGLQTLDDLTHRAAHEAAGREQASAAASKAAVCLASGLQAACLFAQETLDRARQALEAARQEQQQRSAELAQQEQWLAAHAGDAPLETALPGLVESLTRLAAVRLSLAETREAAGKLETSLAAASRRLTALREQKKNAGEKERQTAAAASQAGAALGLLLNGRTVEAVLADSRALEKKWTALCDLRTVMEKRDAAASEGLKISDDETRFAGELEIARVQKTATESEAQVQAALLEATRKNLTLLERIAGYEDQRAQLSPGEPCPLCGGLEHPLARPGAPVSRQIEEARRHVATAKAANATAAKEAEIATAMLARTGEALKNLQIRRAQLRQEQMVSHEAFEKQARALRIFTAESLADALAANRQARIDHETLLDAIREAEQKKGAAELAHVKQQTETARLDEAIAGEQKALERLQVEIATARETAGKRQTELDAQTRRLAEALTPFETTVPAPACESHTRKTLEGRLRAFQKTARERNRLESELKQVAIRADALGQQFGTLGQQARKITEWKPDDGFARLDLDLNPNAKSSADPRQAQQFRALWKDGTDLGEAETALETLRSSLTKELASLEERRKAAQEVASAAERQATEMAKQLEGSPFASVAALREARLAPDEVARLDALKGKLETEAGRLSAQFAQLGEQAEKLRTANVPTGEELAALEAARKTHDAQILETAAKQATLKNELEHDHRNRQARDAKGRELEEERTRLAAWLQLRELIGSADGKKFSRFAQGLSLDILVRHANRHLRRLSERYELRRMTGGELMLEIVDLHQAGVARPMLSLSGGETFLVSLALALGLSDLAGRNVRIDSLFIDEGFGSLDAETLDVAMAALDTLRLNNKTVGIISHVDLLKERIPVHIRVEKQAGGTSVLRLPGMGSERALKENQTTTRR